MPQTRLKSVPQTLPLPESLPPPLPRSVPQHPSKLSLSAPVFPSHSTSAPVPPSSSAYVVTSSSRQFSRLIHIKRHHPERLSAESQVKVDNAPVSKAQQQQLQLTLQQLLQLLSTTTTELSFNCRRVN